MADFSALKTSIQNYIKQNGNEEITGNLLQQILLSMVSTLGDSAINDLVTALNAEIANRGNADTTLQGNIDNEATARGNADTELGGRITTLQGVVNGIKSNVENGYVYAGIATPSSTPASGKVFYLALTAGTYTNFGATVVPQGINILKYNGSAWTLDSFLGLDDAPTQGSSNLVKSGGVLDSIIKDGSAFDLSAYNSGTTYADLSAALTALNALPAAYKKGGMSFKYVQTSDNKYVQYRCKANTFTTDTKEWAICDEGIYEENPEWLVVVTTRTKQILGGFKADGSFEYAKGVPTPIIEYVDSLHIENKVDKEEGKSLIIIDFSNMVSMDDGPEWIDVDLDEEKRILRGIKSDGSTYSHNLQSETIDAILERILNIDKDVTGFKNINDPEGRLEVNLDSEKKIVSYRKSDGTLVEPKIDLDTIQYSENAKSQIKGYAKEQYNASTKERGIAEQKYHFPDYGTVNIKQETFYLSSAGWISYQSDVELRQLYDETEANSIRHITISRFFAGNTPLLFFAASKVSEVEGQLVGAASVTKVNGTCYYTDTLGFNLDGTPVVLEYSMQATVQEEPAEGKSVTVNIPVRQAVDIPPYKAWPVDKKTEHYCLVDIDFGHYLTKENAAIGVKYQGSSTLNRIKRNFRFTFYKNNTFAKKDKIKIGDFVRLSGYNLKANVSDISRVKELILYRLLLDVWEQRPNDDRFPWDKEFGHYTGATGFIKCFPIRTNIGGIFYGMHTFSLKKDEKNYMLDGDDDASGIFVCGTRRDATCWTTATAADWEDEMEAVKPMSQETTDALNTLFAFINNRLEVEEAPVEFNKENIPERMDVLGFIDYFICMQTFLMWDSICRNMILHTRSDKKKFYPYFYDVDLSLNHAYNANIFDIAYDIVDGQRVNYDMSLWTNIKNLYWDEIVNRWCVLRNSVLTIEHVRYVFHKLTDAIPDTDYADENSRWGYNTSKAAFDEQLNKIELRLEWLDKNYFIV